MATRRRFNQATAPQPEQRFPRAQRPSANLFPLAASNIKRGGRNGTVSYLPQNPQPAPMPVPPAIPGNPGSVPPYVGPQPPGIFSNDPAPQVPDPRGPQRDFRGAFPQPPSWGDQNERLPGYQGERGGAGMGYEELWDTYMKLPPRTRAEFLREHPAFAWRLQNQPQAGPHDPRNPNVPYNLPIPYAGPQPSIPQGSQPAPMPTPPGPGVPPVPMPTPPGPGVPPVGPQPEIPHGNEPAPDGVGRGPQFQEGMNTVDWTNQLVGAYGSPEGAIRAIIPGAQFGTPPAGATTLTYLADGTPVWIPNNWADLGTDAQTKFSALSAGGKLLGLLNPQDAGFGSYNPNPPVGWTGPGNPPETPRQPPQTASMGMQTSVPPGTGVPVQSGAPQTLSGASTGTQAPMTAQSPGQSVFPDMSWGGSGGTGGKGGLPISPQFESGRRLLEDQLSQELAAIGVAEQEIPVTLKLIQARLRADEEESMRQIRESTNARGTYASGGTLRDFDLSGRGYERQRRDAQMEAARALGDLARRRQGAHSDFLKGLSDLLLDWQGYAEGERSNEDKEEAPPGKKPKRNRRNRNNRNRRRKGNTSASGAFGTKKAGK